MRILLHFLFLDFDCVENIICPQRKRKTEKENIWCAKEMRKYKTFGEEKYSWRKRKTEKEKEDKGFKSTRGSWGYHLGSV